MPFLILIAFFYLVLPFTGHAREFGKVMLLLSFFAAVYSWRFKLHFSFGKYFLPSLVIIIILHDILLFWNFLNSFILVQDDFVGLSEIFSRTLNGDFFITSFYTNTREMNYLAHHFSPSTIIFAPFMLLSDYRWGYAYALILFHAAAVTVFYFLANDILKNKTQALFLTILFIANPYAYRIFTSYHFEAVFVFFALLLIFFLRKGQLLNYAITFAFLLFLKEDIPAYMFLFSFYVLFFHNKAAGLWGMAAAAVIFLLIPFIQKKLNYDILINWQILYISWGNTYPEIFFNMLTSPFKVIERIFLSLKVLFYLVLGTGTIWLYSALAPMVIVPIILLHILSDRPWFNDFNHYYSYTCMPFILYALVLSWKKLSDRFSHNRLSSLFFLLVCLMFYKNSTEHDFPLQHRKTNPDRVYNLSNAIRLIPKNSRLSVQFDLGAFTRRDTRLYPLRRNYPLMEYILLDEKGFSPYYPVTEIKNLKNSLLKQGQYSALYDNAGVFLLKKL